MIAIFGSGGFIGAYLVDALVGQGKDVYPVDNDGTVPYDYCFDIVDIRDRASLAILPWHEITAVVNLASLQPANDDGTAILADYIRVNTVGLCNILEQCRIHGIKKVVHCTSAKLMSPFGEYATFTISEHAAKQCMTYYYLRHDMDAQILGLTPVYGYGPHLQIFRLGKPYKTGFATFIEKARAGEPIEVWGDCDTKRQIIYIKDAVSAIIAALNTKMQRGYYDVPGPYSSLREQAEIIARLFSQNGHISQIVLRPEIPNDISDWSSKSGLFRSLFDWQPQYDFEAMCRDFIEEERRGRHMWLVDKRRRMMEAKG